MHSNKHENRQIPNTGVSYFIKVNGKTESFDHQIVTGLEIMKASGHDPEKEDLWIKYADGRKDLISSEKKVDLGVAGVEKFRVLPKKLTDGRGDEAPPPLKEEDLKTLNESRKEWELIPWNGNKLLIIRNWDIPSGFNVDKNDVGIVIPLTYPSAQLDMFYFKNPLARADGKQISALSQENFNGEIWQRWSRHRDSSSTWRPDVDDLESHLILLETSLLNELVR
jgi:hypothetical protein